ncbi:MAG: hypothetical protein JW395_1428 [Nitrospira sp.]|nr:hypothetical protein [Nitrospira sp.]
MPEQTLHRWRAQTRVDAGLCEWVTSDECEELRLVNRRIQELERERKLVKETSEIYDALAVVGLNEGWPSREKWYRAVFPNGPLAAPGPYEVKLNGAVYRAEADLLRPDGDIFRLRLSGYEMPRSRSVDIDEVEDLVAAERLLKEGAR